jgi:DNA-binding MarR family transcriptional regulator
MTADPRIALARSLLIVGGRMGQLIHLAIAEHLDEELISNAGVMTLFALDESGSLRPGQIQDLTGLSSGGVSKMLDRLQSAGLVTRKLGAVATDRRASVVSLTPKGRRTTRRVAESVVDQVGEARVLVKEIEHLLAQA